MFGPFETVLSFPIKEDNNHLIMVGWHRMVAVTGIFSQWAHYVSYQEPHSLLPGDAEVDVNQ